MSLNPYIVKYSLFALDFVKRFDHDVLRLITSADVPAISLHLWYRGASLLRFFHPNRFSFGGLMNLDIH
jgi:hypothetical protein